MDPSCPDAAASTFEGFFFFFFFLLPLCAYVSLFYLFEGVEQIGGKDIFLKALL